MSRSPQSRRRRQRAVLLLVVLVLIAGALAVPVIGSTTGSRPAVTPSTWSVAVPGIDPSAQAQAAAFTAARDDEGQPIVLVSRDGSAADGSKLAALSPPRRTQSFMVAGVTWQPTTGIVVEHVALRLHQEGTWSPWTELHPVEGTGATDGDPGDLGRQGTEPLTSAGADGVQARVLTADGQTPTGVQIELVDPGASGADADVAASAQPAASARASSRGVLEPAVVTRAQWGADESLASSWEQFSNGLKAMYVHHTAGTNSYTRAQSPQLVRGIYAYHTQGMHWPDIGYQFLVDKYGTIYQGRRDALHDLPVGAQAGGYNSQTIGVSAMGNYSTAHPSSVMLKAIEHVLAWKAYQYGLNPLGTTRLITGTSSKSQTKHGNGTSVKVDVIQGHRDTNQTACPGTYLYAKLPKIRRAVAKRVEKAVLKHGTARPALAPPARASNPAKHVRPVVGHKKQKFAWHRVPGARTYQVLVQSSTATQAPADSRSWWIYTTTKKKHARVTFTKGQSRVVAVRAVDSAGRRSDATVLQHTVRAVPRASIRGRRGWTTKKRAAFVGGKAFVSAQKGASLTVRGIKATDTVELRAMRRPHGGKLRVTVGAYSTTVSLKTKKKHPRGRVVVPLGQARSGTVVVKKLDRKKTRISTIAFERTHQPAVRRVPVPPGSVTVAPPGPSQLVKTPTVRVTWPASPGAVKYWVYTRTAPQVGTRGPWVKVRSKKTLHARVPMPSEGMVQVGVAAVVAQRDRSAVTTLGFFTPVLELGPIAATAGAEPIERSGHPHDVSDGWYVTKRGYLTSSKKGITLRLPVSTATTRLAVHTKIGKNQGTLRVMRKKKVVRTLDLSHRSKAWAIVTLPKKTKRGLKLRVSGHGRVTIKGVATLRR